MFYETVEITLIPDCPIFVDYPENVNVILTVPDIIAQTAALALDSSWQLAEFSDPFYVPINDPVSIKADGQTFCNTVGDYTVEVESQIIGRRIESRRVRGPFRVGWRILTGMWGVSFICFQGIAGSRSPIVKNGGCFAG